MNTFDSLWSELLPIGRDASTGGYHRLNYSSADLECREWFRSAAGDRSLDVEVDRNGNLWAWWFPADPARRAEDAFVVGSHLDSVRDGGPFDGPLGIVSAFAAIDILKARGIQPHRPVAVAAFADEEGARFGIACAGSRLATGQLDPDRARGLRDDDGITLAEAMTRSGHKPESLGADSDRMARIAAFVELHVEQGRGLTDLGAPMAAAGTIWPHGRYRYSFCGAPNHAGTTRMSDRHDPLQAWSRTSVSADEEARRLSARATFGRVQVHPNSFNSIPSRVDAWMDARAQDEDTLQALLARVEGHAIAHARATGTSMEIDVESATPIVVLDTDMQRRIVATAENTLGIEVPVLNTAAGHDAGILATAGIPTGMLFVRNPTGISHAPEEHAEHEDCVTGVRALAAVIKAMSTE